MTVTDPYTGIGVITRGVFDSDMAAISLSLHSSCNDIALNEKNSPSFCQIHFYRGIFHLLSSCTLSTLRAFNSSSFHPSSPQIHPFSMIPVTPQVSNMQQRSCANLMQEPDAVRPDQREFFCQATFLNRLQHAPDSRKFSVSLRLAQAQHPMWHHLRKPQLLHVRASLHSIWLIDANRSFLLRPETSSSFLHKTRNSPTGKQEYPDLYTCLAATLTAVN